ncbi:hypothetical protein, partial [uncultured Selenomonas sp.]|uniref:hypothetical protein n=1 Tax=uncultured Selenomonas sp. TaxID=159275 RepID=UPI0028DCD40E
MKRTEEIKKIAAEKFQQRFYMCHVSALGRTNYFHILISISFRQGVPTTAFSTKTAITIDSLIVDLTTF